MSSYYLPDLTGGDPDYLQVNQPLQIFQNPQTVNFKNSPIFASSLKIALTDGTGTLLVKGKDWTVLPTDIDQDAMSQAYLENSSFTGQLIKSVTITSAANLNKQVALTYQEFYLTIPGRTFDDGTPFEVSVDLIKNMVSQIASLTQQVARVNSPVAQNLVAPALLPFDINCERAGNVVTGEVVTVNTVAGAKVIRLANGAFFGDTLSLMYNGVALSPTADYLPIGLSSLTAQSTDTGGIYQYILLNGTFSGPVTASYHALGGEVQPTDVNAVYELMVGIQTYLNGALFITESTIPQTPAFRALNARLTLMEDNVRSILTGNPTYGDANSSSGDSVVKAVATVDSNFHWWTIANLYQVQGSTDIVTADQFKGRVYFPSANVALAFTADVNLNVTRNIVSFKTDSVVFDPNYTLFSSLSVNAPVYPMVRLVWNQVSTTFSGASLQIGIPLLTLADRMTVENFSSSESCWIMDKTNPFVTGQVTTTVAPSDTGFTLPDGLSIWSSASSSSYSEICVPRYEEGYLVYAGSTVSLNQIAQTASTGVDFNAVLPIYFPLSAITAAVITMASADGTVVYDVNIPLPAYTAGTLTGRTTFADSFNELMAMSITLTQDVLGNYAVSVNASDLALSTGTESTATMTDVVRYIRAKV